MARLGWLIGITVLAILAFAIERALAQEIQGFPSSGEIPVLTEEAGGQTVSCGGGTYAITRSADLHSIVHVSVEGFRAGDTVFSGSGTFPEGTVPIDPQTGYFSAYFPGREPGQEITVYGSFASFGLAGLGFAVTPSTCAAIGIGLPLPGGGPQLPSNGAGSGTRGGAPWRWELATATFGLLATGVGLALRRRAR